MTSGLDGLYVLGSRVGRAGLLDHGLLVFGCLVRVATEGLKVGVSDSERKALWVRVGPAVGVPDGELSSV